MSELFEAVVNKNIPEVKEILKKCKQDVLEFRGGEVSVFLQFVFC